ncbi:MAG: hypothetical protein JNL62_09095 [Bryobacterales bacterium]|nr:hypothetical protein [Bryobacterales bacterium]
MFHRALEKEPDSYYPRRMVIPMLENWAMEAARRGDRGAALALARRVVELADQVAAQEKIYARAPGWPARVQGWMGEFYELMGDRKAAAAARENSRKLWKVVAARKGLPEDLLAEARRESTAGTLQ